MSAEAIFIALFRRRFESIAEEMGELLTVAALSPNIRERRDHSCALFDSTGDLVAQAAHIPVHLGAAPACVKAVIRRAPPAHGETAIVNDPFAGGTHLPDITLVTAVALGDGGSPWYVATRAHHADIGGIAPGSLPLSRTIDDEGWRVSPCLLDEAVAESLYAASRTPAERRGDLMAQQAANRRGAERLLDLVRAHGADRVRDAGRALLDYSERIVRARLSRLPHGTVRVADVLDDADGVGPPISLSLRLTLSDGRARLDFSGSAPAVPGPMNAVRAITESAVFYVLHAICGEDLPANSGAMRCAELVTEPGSIVDALPPAAVAAGNVETSQRIVDLLLRGFASLAPDRFPACASGTMNNMLVGALPGAPVPWVYYETVGGGYGGGPDRAGASAVQTHMTNTLNTPVEALEHACPMRVESLAVRRGSGGAGRHRGGDGIVRELRLLEPAVVTLIGERRRFPPPGAAGGAPGAAGRQTRIDADDREHALPGKCTLSVPAGTRIRVETPGGGGWGPPESDVPEEP